MAADVVFRVLGPLEVCAAGTPVRLFGPRQERVLAALLVDAGQTVTVARLVDVVWPDSPPATARHQVQDLVSRLRRTLVTAGLCGDVLGTERQGYRLRLADGQLDLWRFEGLVQAAQATQDPAEAVTRLRTALALWRGPALAGLGAPALEPTAASWDERRLDAWEMCLRRELALGHPDALTALAALAARHPARETLATLLMAALSAAGRPSDAAEVYHRLRQRLADDLGVEPGPAARQRYADVLRHTAPPLTDPSARTGLTVPPGLTVIPAQLPRDVRHFAGRQAALHHLDDALRHADQHDAVPVTVIEGPAGIGKTALAVHWAHRVRDRFPDGQLFLDLRGCASDPAVPPVSALARALRALGLPTERIPVDLDEAAGLYRSVLADRRVLVLLDNAGHVEQVRPLLPGTAGCAVLVTSRHRLGGLVAQDGGQRFPLAVLTAAEADDLLARLLGADRVGAEPVAAAELARLCGYLPLALRIAAANLGVRPDEPIDRYTARLRASDRLAVLRLDGDEDSAVRVAFDLSYRALPAAAQATFRLLGLAPGDDVTAEAAAALVAAPLAAARSSLDRLAAGHLVEERAPGRYGLHDLIRAYAADRARTEDTPAQRAAATHRLLSYYLAQADAAAQVLYPQMLRLHQRVEERFAGHAEASGWLDAERGNLVAAVGYAAEHGPYEFAWLLADALRGYFWLRMEVVDWLAVASAARAAARTAGQPRAEASALFSLGGLAWRRGQHDEAVAHFTRGLALAEDTGWVEGQAAMLGNLGGVCLSAGRPGEAITHLTAALALNRRTGRLGGQASNRINLGVVYQEQGQLDTAADHFRAARDLYRRIGARSGEALALANLGDVHRLTGRLTESRGCVGRALDLHGEIGNRGSEADALRCLAEVDRDAGRLDQALDTARRALGLIEDAGLPQAEAAVRWVIASIDHRAGRYGPAVDGYQHALRLARDSGSHHTEAAALAALAATRHECGRPEQALGLAAEAVTVARRYGYRIVLGEALCVRAAVRLARGDADAAADDAGQAVAIQRSTGYRAGEARALGIARECGRSLRSAT